MKLDYEKTLQRANIIYAVKKCEQAGMSLEDMKYKAPEQMPQIASNQVKAMLQALIEELNEETIQDDTSPTHQETSS